MSVPAEEDRQLSFVTPEQVYLKFNTAGLGSRALAHLVDTLIVAAVIILFVLSIMGLQALVGDNEWFIWLSEYYVAMMIVVFFAWIAGYFILMEFYAGGQTIGKKLVDLRVIQDNGQSLTFLASVIRNLFRLLDFMPGLYFLGVVFSFFHPQDKRLGDWVAGTVVVKSTQRQRSRQIKQMNKLIEVMRPRFPLDMASSVIWQKATSEQWQIIKLYAERYAAMPILKRDELAEQILNRLLEDWTLEDQTLAAARVDPSAFVFMVYDQVREDWQL